MSLNRQEKDFLKQTASAIIKANMELMVKHEQRMEELLKSNEAHRSEQLMEISHLRRESSELHDRLRETETKLSRNTLIGSLKYIWAKYVSS